jgi:DNA polymerase-3 subunit delta
MAKASPKKESASEDSGLKNKISNSLFLVYGDDDYLVAEEARKIVNKLVPKNASDFNVEIIEGCASNQNEAAQIFQKLFESIQSQSFFATEKVVWWRDTNLLGSSSTASGSVVSENVEALNELLKQGLPTGTCLVITATDLDGRKGIAKSLQKLGVVTSFKTDPYKQKENEARAIQFAREAAASLGKKLDEETASLIVEMAGGDTRTIHSEVEKMAAFAGEQEYIRDQEVRAVGSWRPGGIVWDLPDAVGTRDLSKALALLDNLLFQGETPIALLFAIISRVRLLLLLTALSEKKLLRGGGDYNSFKSQLDRLPSWVSANLPVDKKLNPLAGHPFALWKASTGLGRYKLSELQNSLRLLLETNERLVSSGSEPQSLLEEALIKICMKS